jgi:hypothetical protein
MSPLSMRLCTAFNFRRCISSHDTINTIERERGEREGGWEGERATKRERERGRERLRETGVPLVWCVSAYVCVCVRVGNAAT